MHVRRAVPIWNDCFFPLVLITSGNLKTLPQEAGGVYRRIHHRRWVLFIGLTLAALPITLL
ncbi:hypothetical protein [Mesorhizobium sp. WSM3860]|uniref:hypothetical protein n=1 Tax=Mesorhizobium sp. WSM3860 TaxID=2029403 RepID=UPI001FE0D279|nr:hypothetical protein [Mesorhizobium sp. WSM3860]